MIKKLGCLFFFGLIIILLLAGYILYDNSRIVVVKQNIEIENLDPSFDGFTILQISDLHSARFGKNQERLVNLLNSLQYDMIAINGDMVDRQNEDILPFLELLWNVSNKKIVFYADGNVGQPGLDSLSGEKTDFGLTLEKEGCVLLDRPNMVFRGDHHIWVSEFFTSTLADRQIANAQARLKTETDPVVIAKQNAIINYQKDLIRIYNDIPPSEVLIGITHYPLSPNQLDNPEPDVFPIFDLILAGHYHGGQIRIPFIGAVYLPAPSPDRFFPPEKIVSGFYQGKQTGQYITRGLGASSTIPDLNFRLFNPPEVNLITLIPRKQ
jgi:uncharacterized protein